MNCLKLVFIIICLLIFFPAIQEEKLTNSKLAVSEKDLWVRNCNENKTGKGYDYRGCQNKTVGGYLCQEWNSNSPHNKNSKSKYNYKNKNYGVGDHNYCRNADNEPTIWCYTTDPKKRWEYCKTRECKDETLRGHKDSQYRGCQNKTRSGYTCQYWNDQHPHKHSRTPTNTKYSGKGVGHHNYCRNPDNEPTIWCYTTNPDKRWEYCNPKTKFKPKPIIITKTKKKTGCSSNTEYKAGTGSLDGCAISCANGRKGAKSNSFSYGRSNRQCWCSPGICKEASNNSYDRYHISQT